MTNEIRIPFGDASGRHDPVTQSFYAIRNTFAPKWSEGIDRTADATLTATVDPNFMRIPFGGDEVSGHEGIVTHDLHVTRNLFLCVKAQRKGIDHRGVVTCKYNVDPNLLPIPARGRLTSLLVLSIGILSAAITTRARTAMVPRFVLRVSREGLRSLASITSRERCMGSTTCHALPSPQQSIPTYSRIFAPLRGREGRVASSIVSTHPTLPLAICLDSALDLVLPKETLPSPKPKSRFGQLVSATH